MNNLTTKNAVPMALAIALELERLHGTSLAAKYLFDAGIEIEVALEVLANIKQSTTPTDRSCR